MARCYVAILVVAVTSSGLHAGPVTVPATSQPVLWQPYQNAKPAQGVGKWRPYDLGMAGVAGGDAKSMWFCSGGFIWRYDIKTRLLKSFSRLDGLTPGVPLITDGQGGCAALFNEGIHRWTEKTGWKVLPPLPDTGYRFSPKTIAFDEKGELYGLTSLDRGPNFGTIVYRIQDGQWCEAVRTDKTAARLLRPVEGGFLLADTGNSIVTFLNADGHSKELWRPANDAHDNILSLTAAGHRVLVLTLHGLRLEYAKGQEQLQPMDAAIVGVDLAGGGYIRKVTGSGKKVRLVADDKVDVEFPFAPEIIGMIFRDANKDLWIGDRRWDGKQWLQIAPEGQISPLPWGMGPPGIIDVFDREPWRAPRYGSRPGNGTELLRITDWQVEVIKTIKTPYGHTGCVLNLVDPKGRLWGWTLGQTPGGNTYPIPFCMTPDGAIRQFEQNYMPVRLNSVGEIYFEGDGIRPGTFNGKVLDEATGKLKPLPSGEAFEALTIPARGATGELSIDPMKGWREKVGDTWLPFRNPYHRSMSGSNSMVCGDRMLVSINAYGIWEFDMANRRWIMLTSGYGSGFFDGKGRRVLDGLVFDGDPFETEKGLKGLAAEDKKHFADLLMRLDANNYKTRDAATEELKKNAAKLAALITEAAGRNDLNLEVQTRLDSIMAHMEKENIRPVDLFSKVHPILRPPPTTQPATAPAVDSDD